MNNIKCDSCQKEFALKIKEKKLPKGIVETYFKCPHCEERYTGVVTDQAVRKLQRQVRKLWEEYRKISDVDLSLKKREEIDQLEDTIKNRINELKQTLASK